MEGIREQLVKRPRGRRESVGTAAVLFGALVLASLIFGAIYVFSGGMLAAIAVLLAGLILWGGWWLTGMFNVEYEYAVVGNELSIDKITNKRSRKTLCTVNLRAAEAFYGSEKHLCDATEIEACGEGDRYTVEYSDPARGKTLLIFTPDERTLEMIKPYLPRQI